VSIQLTVSVMLRLSSSSLRLVCIPLLLIISITTDGIAQSVGNQKSDSLKITKHDKDLPMDPDRVVAFSTSEGSWMSVDVSPDGKSLIFDMLGDLFTMSISGDRAERITTGMAFDTRPKYSPDGKRLLFTSDRDGAENLWVMDLQTKETKQLTKGNDNNYPSADWTPDGNYIVAAKGRMQVKLWLYHVDGGSGVQLTKGADTWKTIDPAVSADGRHIYFSQRTGAWNYNAQLPQYQIGLFDREDGSTQTLTSRYGSAFTPVLSPDGKWLVYGSRFETETGLVIRDLSTGDERWLAYPIQRDDQESIATMGVLPGMSFTPDSKELLATWSGKFWRIPIDGGGAKAIPFEADAEIHLGPMVEFKYPISDDKEAVATQIRDAVPSPDGKHLAFTVLNRLYVMEIPSGTPRRITDAAHTEAQPAWSPDGQSLIWVTWDGTEGHLYKIQPFARNARPVKLTTTPALYTQPAWSYMSERIVMLRGSNRSYQESSGPGAFGSTDDIVWISVNGGNVNFVSKASGRSNPHFVKSSDRIYMNQGSQGLISIRWDGTDQKSHVRVTGITTFGMMDYEGYIRDHSSGEGHDHALTPHLLPDPKYMMEPQTPTSATWLRMAPVGDQALALINNDIYTVTVPVAGEAPTISVSNPTNASFPARKLTQIGGQFPAWSSDATTVHWSIGNAHIVYDLNAAKVFNDSLAVAKKAEEERKKQEATKGDESKDEESNDAGSDKAKKPDTFTPVEFRVKVSYNRDMPVGTILLKGARIITMNGDEIFEMGDILVEQNRIAAVAPSGTITVPLGTQIMDLAGKTIMPGFVDTHAHMWPAWGLHKTEVWNYAVNLAYGVTTTRDPQTATTDVLTYSDMVEAGMMPGPRVYSTGPGLGFWGYNIESLDHARSVMKQYSEYYNTKTIKMYMAGNRKQRQWILMAAKEQQIMPTTEGALNWKLNMTQLIDGYPGHEHAFPIYPIYDDVVKVVATSKMAYTPTLLVAYGGPWAEEFFYATENPYHDQKLSYFTPYTELASKTRRRSAWFMEEEHIFKRHAEFVNDLVAAGGIAGVGAHGQLEGLGYHWELWAMQTGGMSEHDALKVATLHGAKAIGLDSDLGSIEKGKLADLVILDANPLLDIRNTNTVRFVMKNGRMYVGDTLDEIYPSTRSTFTKRDLLLPGSELPGKGN